jgi:hypothetical protein
MSKLSTTELEELIFKIDLMLADNSGSLFTDKEND